MDEALPSWFRRDPTILERHISKNLSMSSSVLIESMDIVMPQFRNVIDSTHGCSIFTPCRASKTIRLDLTEGRGGCRTGPELQPATGSMVEKGYAERVTDGYFALQAS